MHTLQPDRRVPSLKGFDFISLLSHNDLCDTWAAVEKKSGEKVLVKILAASESAHLILPLMLLFPRHIHPFFLTSRYPTITAVPDGNDNR